MDKMRTEWEETEFTFIDYRDTVSLIVGGGVPCCEWGSSHTGRRNLSSVQLALAVSIHWTGLLDWTTGLDYWTHPKWCKMHFPAFFSVGEKLIMYIQPTSLLNSCKFAPLTC